MWSNVAITRYKVYFKMLNILGFRDPLDPLGENSDFEDDDDGRTIVGTIIFKTTDSLIRVSNRKENVSK